MNNTLTEQQKHDINLGYAIGFFISTIITYGRKKVMDDVDSIPHPGKRAHLRSLVMGSIEVMEKRGMHFNE